MVKYSPLHGIFAAQPAVIVFFVLSGLVLAMPYMQGRGDRYAAFAVKRVCRLWFPYAAAVALAMILAVIVGGAHMDGLSRWFNEKWHDPVTTAAIAAHASLVASFDNRAFDGVIWTLVLEMRISLIFPLLVIATMLLGWRRALGLALVLAFVGVLARNAFGGGDYLVTLKYLLCFVCGILLARHWATLTARVNGMGGRAMIALVSFTLLAYTWPYWANEAWAPGPLARVVHHHITDLVSLTLAASLVVLLAQRPGRWRRTLLSRVPQFLGRISYSLYLIHIPILLTVIIVLGRYVNPLVLLPLVWALAVAAGALMQRFVERPAQDLGRRLARSRNRAGGAPAEAVPRTEAAT